MSNYQTTKITSDFLVEVRPVSRGFTLSDHEKILVENIWHHEMSRRPGHLFNGQILNFVALEGQKLITEFVEYKFYIAQLLDPDFDAVLGIRPVSVSGLTKVFEKVLIGKRSATVSTYPNAYECVPSGSIDPGSVEGGRVDILKQFEIELWEETGISVTEVKEIKPQALVYDVEKKTYEICAEISVNYTVLKEELQPSQEYQELMWVSKQDLGAFIRKHEQEFVPFSLFLLKT